MIRKSMLVAAAVALGAGGPFGAAAQSATWPAKPIRLVSPFNPGGAIDVLNRVIAEKLAQRLGQPVIVDAIPGANTIKGADVVAKAPADGYTFMITTMSTHVNNTVLFAKLPFDPVKDFAPITQVSLGSVLLTAPGERAVLRPEGLPRLGQGAEPADQLRLVGRRLVGQRLRRDPGQGLRRQPHARAVQGRAAGDQRRHRRQPRRHLRQPGGRQAAGRRQASSRRSA